MRSWRFALVLVGGSSLVLLSADAAIGQDTKPKTAISAAPKSALLVKTGNLVQAATTKKPQSEAEWVGLANQMLGGSNSMTSIFEVMLAYLKDVAKEAREDAKIANAAKAIALESKAAALEKQNAAIDKGMQEAREKAAIAMDAATTQMMISILGGVIQIGAAVSGGAASGSGSAAAGAPTGNLQRIEPNSGAMAAVKGATPITTLGDAGAPTSSAPSPVGKAAYADAVLGGKLSRAARDEVTARRVDMLDAIVRAWETKSSVVMAIRARAAQNATLGKERFGYVFVSAVFDAYEEALAAVAKAPKDQTAGFRARVALETLRVVSQNL